MKYYYKIPHGELVIDVPGSVYYPHEDSELFADFIVENRKNFLNKDLLEVGCGSGLLSVLCAKFGANVTSVDVNPDAIKATETNSKTNKVNTNVIKSNLFEKIDKKFDIIIFNSPYLPDEDEITKKAFSEQYSNRGIIKSFLNTYKKYLKENGTAFILVSSITDEKIKGKIVKKKKIDWEELRIVKMV